MITAGIKEFELISLSLMKSWSSSVCTSLLSSQPKRPNFMYFKASWFFSGAWVKSWYLARSSMLKVRCNGRNSVV